jgi:hypothetical protein
MMAARKKKVQPLPGTPEPLADFRNFLTLVWRFLLLPDPTPVQYDIAEYLQHGPRRQVIMAFRGVGKSWITSAFILWRLYLNPEEKFLVVSASKQRSDDFSIFTKRLINEMLLLQHLIPTDDQRSSNIAFDVAPARAAHAPSVKSVGVMGQMTGSRATHVIADDVEVANNSDTEDKRDKLLKTIMEFEAIIMPDVGRITYLGTPQTEASVYNKLREKGYDCRIYPSRYPTPDKLASFGGSLAPSLSAQLDATPSLAGRPTDPRRFNDLDLIEREAAYGRSGFALQFQLDTTLSDAERYPLKQHDLILFDCSTEKAPVSMSWAMGPQQMVKDLANVGFTGDRLYRPLFIDPVWAPYEGSMMFIDPSGRGKDETGYAVVKQLHGKLFITACGGLVGGYDASVLRKLAEIAKAHKVNYIQIEANFGDGMFTQIFTPVLGAIYPCTTEEVKVHIQKEKRIIDTLEPVMNQHRLVLDYGVAKADLLGTEEDRKYSLLYQLTHITKDRGALRHDDRLDALAGAVAYWTEFMARDEAKAYQSHREGLLDADLKKFMDHVMGRKPQLPRWIRGR